MLHPAETSTECQTNPCSSKTKPVFVLCRSKTAIMHRRWPRKHAHSDIILKQTTAISFRTSVDTGSFRWQTVQELMVCGWLSSTLIGRCGGRWTQNKHSLIDALQRPRWHRYGHHHCAHQWQIAVYNFGFGRRHNREGVPTVASFRAVVALKCHRPRCYGNHKLSGLGTVGTWEALNLVTTDGRFFTNSAKSCS